METIKTISLIRNKVNESGQTTSEVLLNFKIKNDVEVENMENVCNMFNQYLDNALDETVFFVPNERMVLNIDLNNMSKEAKEKLLNDLETTFTDNQLSVVSNAQQTSQETEENTQGE